MASLSPPLEGLGSGEEIGRGEERRDSNQLYLPRVHVTVYIDESVAL
jgi:hypothetical protein